MGKVLLAATSLSWFVDLFFRRSWVRDGQSHILEPRTAAETACTAEKDMNSAIQKVKATNYHRSNSGNMRRAAVSGIVVLFAAIVSIAVIASTNSADEATELLKLLPNGMPDISGIQTQPATKSQIMAQMKKDGLTLDLFKKLPPAVKSVDLSVHGGKPTTAQVKAALAMQKIMMQNAEHDDKLVAQIRESAAKLEGPP